MTPHNTTQTQTHRASRQQTAAQQKQQEESEKIPQTDIYIVIIKLI